MVSMPPDTPLQSDCEDSITEVIPFRNNDIYESGIHDSYYDKSRPRSRPISSYSDSTTVVPRIVITPTAEDNEKRRASLTNYENVIERQYDSFGKLTTKLNQICSSDVKKSEVTSNEMSQKIELNFDFDKNQILKHEPINQLNSLPNKSNCEDDRILQHNHELDNLQSETDSETEENDSHSEKSLKEVIKAYERTRHDSLFEIEDIQEPEIHSDDESADIIEFIIDNSGDATSNCDTVEFNDHLSVIFEEDEHLQSRRMKLDSICSSNSSATLACDENIGSKHFDSESEEYEEEENGEEEDDGCTVESDNGKDKQQNNQLKSDSDNDCDNEQEDNNDDDQSTSVTVRLPLRLSFSRSSNGEELTTVMVGKSEIHVEENVSSCKTPAMYDSSPDVSVSISLPPRSRPTYSQQSSADSSNDKILDNDNYADEDSEVSVSVSVSLPLRHCTLSPAPYWPAFTRQQTLSPVPVNHEDFEYQRWDRGFSVESSTNVPNPKKYNQKPSENINQEHIANSGENISNVRENCSNTKLDDSHFKADYLYADKDSSNRQNHNSNDFEPENLLVRGKIAAFETIPKYRKVEFHRQNACTSFIGPNERRNTEYEKDVGYDEQKEYRNDYKDNAEHKEVFDNNQALYMNSHQLEPQTSKSDSLSYTKVSARASTPNYESYIANEYIIVQSTPQFIQPEFVESHQPQYELHTEYSQSHEINFEQQSANLENDFKVNLSVSQKIAAFEQPASFTPTKIDAHQQITTARKSNNSNSVGNRFLAQVNENQIQALDKSHAQRIHESQSEFRCSSDFQKNHNAKLNKLSYMQRSTLDESEIEETDSGVDIHRQISEDIDTESECYSELRKMSQYVRAQTHSRLFNILQEYVSDVSDTEKPKVNEVVVPLSRPKKIVHNVSITRKQNPELVTQAETKSERRERLFLNHNSSSIDADNPSSSASPSCISPTLSVNEKLIDELVHSVLQQTKRGNLRNIPIDKIQAAARCALLQQQEENDSCDTYSSFDSTPAVTPQEFHDDYYDSDADRNVDIFPSKAFKHLQEQSMNGRKKLWAARCPRVLSSKTVNSDLSRVTETRESQTPERDQHYVYN